MKPVLKNIPSYYISESELIEFIEINSNMNWNQVCYFVKENIFNEDGSTYYSFKSVYSDNFLKDFHEDCIWIKHFFEAHDDFLRFSDGVYFVFDE
jgi:hypothetical protein